MTTFACLDAFSATPCASRRAKKPSNSSSASVRPRSASTATTRAGARRELAAILDSLDNDQTLAIVRAFSYFSHLANIAEDQHHIRRNRAHVVKRSAPRPGSLAYAFQRAREAGIDAEDPARLLRRRADQPGAHRPSDRGPAQEHADARTRDRRAARRARALTATRQNSRETRSNCAAPSTALAHQHAAPARLKVIDEVSNGLSYYDYTFFRELPRLYGAIEDELARQAPAAHGNASPRSCGSARGSAATATAIRSSPPKC